MKPDSSRMPIWSSRNNPVFAVGLIVFGVLLGMLFSHIAQENGSSYSLGTFTINLNGDESKVLRMEVEVPPDTREMVKSKRAELRDLIIKVSSDYSPKDVAGVDGKLRLQDDLLGSVNRHLGEDSRIERIYFTDFLVE
mgnify:CR=1 FL=1